MKLLQGLPMKTSSGFVFDIKRFALHDGDGLRTTIFFKGCPLRCKWCQNPEGISIKPNLLYLENKCMHCRSCKSIAKTNQLIYRENRPYINREYVDGFENIVQACPTGALCYDSQEYTVDQLIEKIKADKVFYQYGGGVTFSGGEPFMQGEFLLALLKRCKEEKIHIAIETSLYTSKKYIEQALPYLDLWYVDLKLYNDKKHKQYTSVSGKIIKENIRFLLQSVKKDKVIIRTPLIPAITATKENIADIASFLVEIYPEVKYELLNYNALASSKYRFLDMEYAIDHTNKPYNEEQLQHFYHVAIASGIKNLIVE